MSTLEAIVVLFSRSVMSDFLWPHGLQHAKPPCPSSPGAYSSSCPLNQWCHPTISSSVIPFSSCLQSFPASGSFPMSHHFSWSTRCKKSMKWILLAYKGTILIIGEILREHLDVTWSGRVRCIYIYFKYILAWRVHNSEFLLSGLSDQKFFVFYIIFV